MYLWLSKDEKGEKVVRLLLSGDWHLREKAPQARIDDYFRSQEEKLDWLFNLALEKQAVILQPGDFFDTNPPTEFIKQRFINKRGKWLQSLQILTIFGQHDMLHHSLKSLDRTGLAVLEAAGVVNIIDGGEKMISIDNVDFVGCHWGQEVPRKRRVKGRVKVLVIHRMLINEPLWPGQDADYGEVFLKKYKEYDLIVSGDNHQFFMFQGGGRFLFNAGSLMRMTAAQFDHKPAVGIYDTDTRKLEVIEIPCASVDEVLTREHIDKVEERDERLRVFIDSLKQDYEIGLSFRDNLQKHFEENEIEQEIRDLIWENM